MDDEEEDGDGIEDDHGSGVKSIFFYLSDLVHL